MRICSDRSGISLHLSSFFFLWIVLASSCNEEVVTPPEIIDFPYEGIWTGNTSEMNFIQLEFSITGGLPVAYRLNLTYLNDTVLQQMLLTNVNGLVSVDSTFFSLELPDLGYVNGEFEDDSLLTGKIRILADNNAYKMLSYSAIPAGAASGIHTVSGASFTIGDQNFQLVQTDDNFFPATIYSLTDSSLVAGTAVTQQKGFFTGKSILQINAGEFRSLKYARRYFIPGDKQYADKFNSGLIEVEFYDPNYYFARWASTNGAACQENSYFSLKEVIHIPTSNPLIQRMKIFAQFSCNIYNHRGDTLHISDGAYIGFIDLPAEDF